MLLKTDPDSDLHTPPPYHRSSDIRIQGPNVRILFPRTFLQTHCISDRCSLLRIKPIPMTTHNFHKHLLSSDLLPAAVVRPPVGVLSPGQFFSKSHPRFSKKQ